MPELSLCPVPDEQCWWCLFLSTGRGRLRTHGPLLCALAVIMASISNGMGAMPFQALPIGNASGDADQKPKRARTSKPKVKTGCNNCK